MHTKVAQFYNNINTCIILNGHGECGAAKAYAAAIKLDCNTFR